MSGTKLHPVFAEILKPYSGTLIQDLTEQVEMADPVTYLGHVKRHLVDRAYSYGDFNVADQAAWVIVDRIQECLEGDMPVPYFLVCFVCCRPYELVAKKEFADYMRTNFICEMCDGDYS